MNRWIGIFSCGFMLIVNALLFNRDIAPRWFAGERPPCGILGVGDEANSQARIEAADGQVIGRTWTRSSCSKELRAVRSITFLERLNAGQMMLGSKIVINTEIIFTAAGQLSTIGIKVDGLGLGLQFRGEFFEPDNLACRYRVADMKGEFVLEGVDSKAVADMTKPFDRLSGLYVGQSWQMELVNPLQSLMPRGAAGLDPEPVIVRVTGREPIEHAGKRVEAFVVEADRVRAWVGDDGMVLRQEVDLPILGRLTLIDEPYDRALRDDYGLRWSTSIDADPDSDLDARPARGPGR